MTRSGILSIVLCLGLTSTAAFATDGVIEINQARALAGGVTPGDATGFPVTISQSGSYRLTSNLTVASASTSAISISGNDVTIDLNGFAITGPNVCTAGTPTTCSPSTPGDGVGSVGGERVTVRNGTITGMGRDGVNLGAFSRIENVRASQNAHSGILAGQSSVIIGCIADVNLVGFSLPNGSCVIQSCASVNNANQGFLVNGAGNVISGCTIRANGSAGISGAVDSLVTGSTVTGNTLAGLLSASSTVYSNCLFAGNNGANPEVSGGVQIGTNICNGAACP